MKSLLPIRVLFVLTGLYDLLLGLAFLLAAPAIFEAGKVTPPNHMGYARFPGALVAIFGLMFLQVACKPLTSRSLIVYGILLKLSYVGMIVYYATHGGVPAMWVPFAYADVVMLLLMAWAWVALGKRPQSAPVAA